MKKFDYILGLPITEGSVSAQFMEYINSDEKKILISVGNYFFNGVDYRCSKIGYEVLVNSGFKIYSDENDKIFIPPTSKKSFVQIDMYKLFSSQNNSGNGIESILEKISALVQTINTDCEIGLVCQGSPFVYETICSSLLNADKDIKVIDTDSSPVLIKEWFGSQKELNIHHIQSDDVLKEDGFNVIGCVGEFQNILNLQKLIDTIKNFDEIHQIHLSYDKSQFIRKINKNQLAFEIKKEPRFFDDSSLAVFNN